MRGDHLSWIKFEGGIGYISPCSAAKSSDSPPPPQAINNDRSLILSFLSSHTILFNIGRNLRSLLHFINMTVNSWFSSFQVVLLDRLRRSQVHIRSSFINFKSYWSRSIFIVFFWPGTEHEIDSHGFYSESVRQLRHIFLSFWKMTSKKQSGQVSLAWLATIVHCIPPKLLISLPFLAFVIRLKIFRTCVRHPLARGKPGLLQTEQMSWHGLPWPA